MSGEPTVVVCGSDAAWTAETADRLREADGDLAVETATEVPDGDGIGCLVTDEFGEVADASEAHPQVPVVVFGDGPPRDARAALTAGADYVQRSGEAAGVVLAHRVRAALRDAGAGEATKAQYAGVVEALDDGVYALDDEGRFTYTNEAMAELTGYSSAELRGEHVRIVKDEATVERAERELAALLSADEDGGSTTVELELRPRHGEPFPCEDHMAVLRDGAGNFRGTAGVVRDITTRKRRQRLVERLQETSRALMQAPSREAVADIVADAARSVLGFDFAVVRLYDADERVLRPVAATDPVAERMSARPVYGLDEGQPGKVFASGEPAAYDDLRTLSDGIDREPARSAMYFPIGVHGTLSVAATTVDAFDDIDRQVASLLATNAAAACNRAKREQEVREARERIATILERINGLIQNTVEVLVEAATRAEVEAGVCAELAAADPYTFAWLGRPDVRAEVIEAREAAGAADLDVSGVTEPMDGDGPGARALATGESQVLDLSAGDPEGWLADARRAGVESVMAVPLSYTDSDYGVLYVCADRADAFDERERVVLEALGRAVANAVNAIESGRILSANEVIELEFTIDDRELLFSRLSGRTDARVESAGTVAQEDGSLRLYLTATGGDSEELLALLRDDDAVAEATLVAEHDGEALFDVTVTDSLIETLVDHGAVPKSVTSEDGITRYAIELPYEAEAREVFGLVEDRYDATDLVGYHEHERPVRTQQEFRAALSDRFTDRQETALRTAYLGGFFEWPREVDGDELATGMDISRPTYHQHLRAAQQKVFEELFE